MANQYGDGDVLPSILWHKGVQAICCMCPTDSPLPQPLSAVSNRSKQPRAQDWQFISRRIGTSVVDFYVVLVEFCAFDSVLLTSALLYWQRFMGVLSYGLGNCPD
jgi:hypothetical protein